MGAYATEAAARRRRAQGRVGRGRDVVRVHQVRGKHHQQQQKQQSAQEKK